MIRLLEKHSEFEAFWGFSLAFYSYESIQPSCLRLQDEAQFDVNILLYLLWFSMRTGKVLTTEQVELLIRHSSNEAEVVREFRSYRRKVIDVQIDSNAFIHPQLKRIMLDAELLLEQQNQNAILDIASHHFDNENDDVQHSTENIELDFIATENLDVYSRLMKPPVSFRSELQTLVNQLINYSSQRKAV